MPFWGAKQASERWLAPPPGVTVARTEPQRVLELDWRPSGEPPSTVRIELLAEGERTVLVLEHTRIDAAQFSPDGNWVSFSSLRTGNWDIFVVPVEGGEPQRLTWNSGSDIADSWSPDGKNLLFTAQRETGDAELLTLDVKTLRIHKLRQDYVAMPT